MRLAGPVNSHVFAGASPGSPPALREGHQGSRASRSTRFSPVSAGSATCLIDHITILSPSLEAGGAWVHERLGVPPQQGGAHPRMGTHNLLLPLGETMFLEVIAIDPAAPAPARPRWFDLDRLPPDRAPFLGCWVARTTDIHASLAAASEPLGLAEPMTRGALEWLISIPEDGSLPLGGAAPELIQWHTAGHPAAGMQDRGCRLTALQLLHPEPERLRALIESLRFAACDAALTVKEAPVPGLVAQIDTPSGPRALGAPGQAAFPRESARLVLRRLRASDLAAFQAYRSDEAVGRYQGWPSQTDRQALAFIDAMNDVPLFPRGDWAQLAIADRATDELVGDLGVRVSADGDEAEVGFTIAPRFQGRGLGTEAVRAAASLIFERSTAVRIIGITDARNAASVRLLERVGMHRVATADAVFRGESCVGHTYALGRHRAGPSR